MVSLRSARGRAAAESIGALLVLAFVIGTASLLFVAGSEVVEQTRSQSEIEGGEVLVQEVDARIGSVASADGEAATVVDLANQGSGDVSVRHGGHVDLSVNGGTCEAEVAMPAVTVRNGGENGDSVVAYQAGGVWRQAGDGSTAMVAPPDLTFGNGSLSLTVTNLTGRIGSDRFRVSKNVTASRERTAAIRDVLSVGDCRRPNSVTVSVTSDYSGAWADYLRSEVNTTVTRTGDRTVAFTLDSSRLPRSVDDGRNRVVDLTDPGLVSPAPSNGRFPGDDFAVDKSVGNDYLVSAAPVENGTVVSGVQEFDRGTVLRRPVDVAVVMDESGSMNSAAAGGGSKIENAQDAAKRFVGLTNASRDRVALVGYTTEARYELVEDQYYFSSDHDALNDSIDDYDASGGTTVNRGLNASLAVHDVKSNASRDRHVILLSDGQNSPGSVCGEEDFDDTGKCQQAFDERTLSGAEAAAAQGVVVHTIAFGTNADEDLLKDIAEETNGTYSKATTGAELTQVFRGIFQSITESEQLVQRPVSTELAVGGTTFKPEAAGSDADLAVHDGYVNLNDPSFDGSVSYAVDTTDGAVMELSAVELTCAEYELTPFQHTNDSTGETFNEVRCANATGVDRTLPSENVTVYIDGADVSGLRDRDRAWWQPDLYNDTLGPYRDGTTLDLESNEAIVLYEYDRADSRGDDRLVMRYEVGLPESTRTAFVLDVSVTEARIDG